MESFNEYVELKEEEAYTQEMLNEDPLIIAGAVLGYAAAGLLIGWGGALLVTGYTKLLGKFVTSIKRTYKRFFKKDKSPTEITKALKDLKTDTNVRIQQNKMKDESRKYDEDFKEVFAAIRDKEAIVTKEKVLQLKLDQKLINRMVVLETTRAFGEPPLHYGNTGNSAYLFVKKVLGIKVAQAASMVVKKAFESKGTELVKEPEPKVTGDK